MKRSLSGAVLALTALAALAGPRSAAQNNPPAPPAVSSPAAPAKTISVDFRDMQLRDALDTLFKGTGYNHMVTPEAVQAAPTVTLSLQDVTFDNALNILVRTAGLKCHKDRDTGVYIVEARTPEVSQAPTAAPATALDMAPELVSQVQIEKIVVNYADSVDIYGALSGQGSNRAGSQSGNSGFGNGSGGFGSSSFGNSGFGNSSSGFGSSSFGSSGFGSSSGFGNSSSFGSSSGFGR